MTMSSVYFYLWVTMFVCLLAGPVPQRHHRIAYGLKILNQLNPRRYAIKITPTTSTTTTMTTTTTSAVLDNQNPSFRSIDDYLNYDYDYLNYYYDLNYDDTLATENGNQGSNVNSDNEPVDLASSDNEFKLTPSLITDDILKKDKITEGIGARYTNGSLPEKMLENIASDSTKLKIKNLPENVTMRVTVEPKFEEKKILNKKEKLLHEDETVLDSVKIRQEEDRTSYEKEKKSPEVQSFTRIAETIPEEGKISVERRNKLTENETLPQTVENTPKEGKTLNEKETLTESTESIPEDEKILQETQANLHDSGITQPLNIETIPKNGKIFFEVPDKTVEEEDTFSRKVAAADPIKKVKSTKLVRKTNLSKPNPIVSDSVTNIFKDNVLGVLTNTDNTGREGRILEYETSLQDAKKSPEKGSDSLNSKSEFLLETVSKGIKQLRYTTQSPEVPKLATTQSLQSGTKASKVVDKKDQNAKDIVNVVSERTVTVDVPKIGFGAHSVIDNSSQLGWRSESSVSVKVSIKSSRPRGKEISSSVPVRRRILDLPERTHESMQLKEVLSLEVSATPKITELAHRFKPGITEAKTSKRVRQLITPLRANNESVMSEKASSIMLHRTTKANIVVTTEAPAESEQQSITTTSSTTVHTIPRTSTYRSAVKSRSALDSSSTSTRKLMTSMLN